MLFEDSAMGDELLRALCRKDTSLNWMKMRYPRSRFSRVPPTPTGSLPVN